MNRFDGVTIYPDVPDYVWVQDDPRTWFSHAGTMDCFVERYRDYWMWAIQEGYGNGNLIASSALRCETGGYHDADEAMRACERFIHRTFDVGANES